MDSDCSRLIPVANPAEWRSSGRDEFRQSRTVLDPGSTGALNNYIMNLNDGVYSLRFVNLGSQPVTINWQLRIAGLDWEKIIDNGVGQSPALSLSLLSAAPTDTGPGSTASFQVNFPIRDGE